MKGLLSFILSDCPIYRTQIIVKSIMIEAIRMRLKDMVSWFYGLLGLIELLRLVRLLGLLEFVGLLELLGAIIQVHPLCQWLRRAMQFAVRSTGRC
jgi:hypothetical protein